LVAHPCHGTRLPLSSYNNLLQHFINRVFDFLLKEKASDVGSSLKGLLFAVAAAVVKPLKEDTNTATKSSIARTVA
jgi:hypothetical protein